MRRPRRVLRNAMRWETRILAHLLTTLWMAVAVIAAFLICHAAGQTLLFAPLAGTAVIVFSAPNSAMARWRAAMGGHSLSGAIGLLCASLAPAAGVGCAVVVASTVAFLAMLCSDTVHSPAGATPAALAGVGGLGGVPVSALFHLLIALLTILLIARLGRHFGVPSRPTGISSRHEPSITRTE